MRAPGFRPARRAGLIRSAASSGDLLIGEWIAPSPRASEELRLAAIAVSRALQSGCGSRTRGRSSTCARPVRRILQGEHLQFDSAYGLRQIPRRSAPIPRRGRWELTDVCRRVSRRRVAHERMRSDGARP